MKPRDNDVRKPTKKLQIINEDDNDIQHLSSTTPLFTDTLMGYGMNYPINPSGNMKFVRVYVDKEIEFNV